MVVDTFRIPSACTCNYIGRFGIHLRGSFETKRSGKPPRCNADNATQNLGALSTSSSNQVSISLILHVTSLVKLKSIFKPFSKRLSLAEPHVNRIQPCESGEIICEAEDQSYPKQSIEKMLRTHVAFKSPK